MPEADNNVIIIGENQPPEFETVEESVIPPLPPVEASEQEVSEGLGMNIFLYILFVGLVLLLIFMMRSRKNKEKKISEIIEAKPEEQKEEKEEKEERSIPTQKAVTKQDYININEPKTNQTKFTFSTPKNLDTCIKKFLEITKKK